MTAYDITWSKQKHRKGIQWNRLYLTLRGKFLLDRSWYVAWVMAERW
jgi:hypothetical protein